MIPAHGMRHVKLVPVLLILSGIAVGLTGAALVYAYVMDAVIARIGEPDQSLLFWYFPFLAIGLAFSGGGIGLFVWGVRRLRGDDGR